LKNVIHIDSTGKVKKNYSTDQLFYVISLNAKRNKLILGMLPPQQELSKSQTVAPFVNNNLSETEFGGTIRNALEYSDNGFEYFPNSQRHQSTFVPDANASEVCADSLNFTTSGTHVWSSNNSTIMLSHTFSYIEKDYFCMIVIWLDKNLYVH
jgi:hypothetical protein